MEGGMEMAVKCEQRWEEKGSKLWQLVSMPASPETSQIKRGAAITSSENNCRTKTKLLKKAEKETDIDTSTNSFFCLLFAFSIRQFNVGDKNHVSTKQAFQTALSASGYSWEKHTDLFQWFLSGQLCWNSTVSHKTAWSHGHRGSRGLLCGIFDSLIAFI